MIHQQTTATILAVDDEKRSKTSKERTNEKPTSQRQFKQTFLDARMMVASDVAAAFFFSLFSNSPFFCPRIHSLKRERPFDSLEEREIRRSDWTIPCKFQNCE